MSVSMKQPQPVPHPKNITRRPLPFRVVLTLLLFMIQRPEAAGKEPVRFRLQYSGLYATYDFITRISDSYPENKLKSVFLSSRFNTDSLRRQIAAFEQLKLDYSYAFPQFPQPLKTRLISRDLLEKNLALSASIPEFANRSAGLVPAEDLRIMSAVLSRFQPVYDTLIYQPSRRAFDSASRALRDFTANGRLSRFFQAGLDFYNTSWDKDLPFEIVLTPTLDRDNLGARTFANIAFCDVPVALREPEELFIVAMHEIYHSLYDQQPASMKVQLQQWFDKTGSENSQYALLLMNEALATALGNGYVSEQLTGMIPDGEWYGNPYISEMAKSIYPVCRAYLARQQPIDEAFVKAYVQAYDSALRKQSRELAHLFSYRYVIATDNADLQAFTRHYRRYSNSRLAATFTPSELQSARDMPLTKVLVVSGDHLATRAMIRQCFPELDTALPNYRKEFVHVLTLGDRTKLFLINRYRTPAIELLQHKFPGGHLQQK
jgi:hypothetical protein